MGFETQKPYSRAEYDKKEQLSAELQEKIDNINKQLKDVQQELIEKHGRMEGSMIFNKHFTSGPGPEEYKQKKQEDKELGDMRDQAHDEALEINKKM